MTSIIVSSDDLAVGQTIGKKTADALGYRYFDRGLLKQVAKQFDVKEEKLLQVLDGSPAARLSAKTRDLLISYIQTLTLEQMQKDNVVCTNLAAHLYVRDVSHVLIIRVLADSEARAERIMARKGVSLRKALKIIEQKKSSRARWSIDTFALDENDPSIYDLMISLGQIEPEKVVEIIKDMAGYRKFQPMTYSVKCMDNLAMASRVRSMLLPKYPEIKVAADGGRVIVKIKCPKWQKLSIVEAIKKSVGKVPGVSLVEVHAVTNLRKLGTTRSARA
jgi:cytidylate kinase